MQSLKVSNHSLNKGYSYKQWFLFVFLIFFGHNYQTKCKVPLALSSDDFFLLIVLNVKTLYLQKQIVVGLLCFCICNRSQQKQSFRATL